MSSPNLKHVWYSDYIKKSDAELRASDNGPELKSGRFFQLVERTSKSDPITTISKRDFGAEYQQSLPSISGDQKLLCMPRFDCSGGEDGSKEGIIDVFDCEAEEFWRKGDSIDRSDEHYKFSLKMSDEADVGTYMRVVFSETNKFACI